MQHSSMTNKLFLVASLLTAARSLQLKSRFGGFADGIEKIHEKHSHLSVPSLELRESLIKEGLDIVKERYEYFWREYGDIQFR